ncbi:hypothetical protein N8914_05910 [Planktomarina temperata]|nr:hypothetical protein [Planktomarina temperata]
MESENLTDFERYLNARPLDVHTWSDHPEVNAFVNDIYSQLSSIQGNERINKKLLKVVLLDLYVAWCTDPELMIMFSRDNNVYKAKSRYNEIHIGKKVIGVVDELVNEGIIEEKRGFNDKIRGIGFQSRLWASPSLKEKFKSARFHQFQFCDHEDRESILLRDENKEDIEGYTDNAVTKYSRSLLTDYNTLLANTHIDILDLDQPVIEIGSGSKTMKLAITQQDKFVRRIFNNSRWDQGGRFYGGWWQRCPKEYREKIEFDGVGGLEVDFSGMHIVILYAQEGINYWADIGDDPYSIKQIEAIDPNIDLRSACKLLLLTAINADSQQKAFQAFRQQSEPGSLEKKLTNAQLSKLLDTLGSKHQPIVHRLASGAGIDLMFVDSQITEKLIDRFTNHYRCPILTIHDSYIVPFGYDKRLAEEMQSAFQEVTKISNPIVKPVTDYYDVLQLPIELIDNAERLAKYTPTTRHLREKEEFRLAKNKPQIEPWYPKWTSIY